MVTIRKPKYQERQHLASLHVPAPLLFPGQLVRCTNANAREFTHEQVYRVVRTVTPPSGPVLAVVRNDNMEERVLTSLSWAHGHWVRHYV